MQPLVNVYRGDRVESTHSGSIAIVDSLGRLVAYAGDPHHATFIRSAAKPFQAVPLVESGGLEEFAIAPEELALICASHGGEPLHVTTAAAILRKGDYDEADLRCGIHVPYDEKAANDLRLSGEAPSPLHNNCSGKHGGMLLASRYFERAGLDYSDAHHPLQQRAREVVGDFAGLAGEVIPTAIDGCGVPSYYLSLHRAAYAYARLVATAEGTAGALEEFAPAAAAIVQAMTERPHYVAGNWSITTPLMESYPQELLAKEGAEGFYAIALKSSLAAQLSEQLDLTPNSALGVAIKIADGSMGRGRDPVIVRILRLLGLESENKSRLDVFAEPPVRNNGGAVVGAVRAEFSLVHL